MLRSPLNNYRSHRDATPACRVVVPLDLNADEFRQALRDNVSDLPEHFELCRVTGQRAIVPLEEQTPQEIKNNNALGRSNLYLRPKITGETVDLTVDEHVLPEVQPNVLPSSETSEHHRRDSIGSEVISVLPDRPDNEETPCNVDDFYIESDVSDVDEEMLASPDRSVSDNEMDLAAVLGQFSTSNVDTSNSVVIARRKHVLKSACMALSKSYFAWNKVPNIEFVGEMADDYGGPRREFFRLVMMEVQSSMGVFEGKPGNLMFTYSQQLLSSSKYYTAGKLTAWSVIHNGPGPRSLNKELFSLMCGHTPSFENFDMELFVDQDIRDNIDKVANCRTANDVSELKSHLGDWIANCGIPNIFTATLDDMPRIREEILAHLVFHRVASVIQQYVAGMDSCNQFWQMVKSCWKQFLPVFTFTGEKMTRDCLLKLFDIAWSPAGSNKREEEDTIFQWEWWLMAIQEREVDHTFEELLVFITGAGCLPPLGFPHSCTIDFYDQEPGSRRIPYASTCSLCLFLPRGAGDEAEFKELMHTAIKGSLGFGKA